MNNRTLVAVFAIVVAGVIVFFMVRSSSVDEPAQVVSVGTTTRRTATSTQVVPPPPPPAPATVTVSTHDPIAAEPLDSGTFRISRTGSTASRLAVNFSVSGTALNGVDYQQITSPKTIPIGSASVDVVVSPIDDAVVENTETVFLTLLPGSYIIGSSSSSTVTILDNDVPLADLITQNLSSSFATTSTSTVYSFFGTVANIGGGSATSSSQTRLRVNFNASTTLGWDLQASALTGPLAPNASENESWISVIATSTPPGGHLFEVCADTASQIAEGNETNNCSTKTF